MDLEQQLLRIIAAFEENGIQFALVGGLAMAVYGFPRATVDIDFLVAKVDVQKALDLLEQLGFDFKGLPMHFHEGKLTIYRRTGIFPGDKDVLPVDLLVLRPDEEREFLNNRQETTWNEHTLQVLGIDHYIALKQFRNSKRDQGDIEQLLPLKDRNEDTT